MFFRAFNVIEARWVVGELTPDGSTCTLRDGIAPDDPRVRDWVKYVMELHSERYPAAAGQPMGFAR